MTKKIYDKYEILPGKDVNLTVKFGEGQIGAYLVKIENEVLEEDDNKIFTIPSEKKLSGKTLYISAVVTDVNPNTNRISLSYSFKGGKDDYNASPVKGEIEEEGGIAFYNIIVVLYIGQ